MAATAPSPPQRRELSSELQARFVTLGLLGVGWAYDETVVWWVRPSNLCCARLVLEQLLREAPKLGEPKLYTMTSGRLLLAWQSDVSKGIDISRPLGEVVFTCHVTLDLEYNDVCIQTFANRNKRRDLPPKSCDIETRARFLTAIIRHLWEKSRR